MVAWCWPGGGHQGQVQPSADAENPARSLSPLYGRPKNCSPVVAKRGELELRMVAAVSRSRETRRRRFGYPTLLTLVSGLQHRQGRAKDDMKTKEGPGAGSARSPQ